VITKTNNKTPLLFKRPQSKVAAAWCGNHKLAHLIEIPSNQNSSGSANWHDNKFIMFESYKGPVII
jgi:hypothetical protein